MIVSKLPKKSCHCCEIKPSLEERTHGQIAANGPSNDNEQRDHANRNLDARAHGYAAAADVRPQVRTGGTADMVISILPFIAIQTLVTCSAALLYPHQ
jgi:hypothetical protein